MKFEYSDVGKNPSEGCNYHNKDTRGSQIDGFKFAFEKVISLKLTSAKSLSQIGQVLFHLLNPL